MKKGKLIGIYGINNTGKSTQAKLLVERLKKDGKEAEYLKYPIYDLEPSGPLINEYLRNRNPHNFSVLEIQLIYVLNRTQYEPIVKEKLESGINIIAEDYSGTGIAWGIGGGMDYNFAVNMNSHLLKEDLVFLLDGERFMESKESGHRHEEDHELTNRVREVHKELGKEFGWLTINANDTIENIHKIIHGKVKLSL